MSDYKSWIITEIWNTLGIEEKKELVEYLTKLYNIDKNKHKER